MQEGQVVPKGERWRPSSTATSKNNTGMSMNNIASLQQLRISPAPWSVKIRDNKIIGLIDAKGIDLVVTDDGECPPLPPDAILMAAAPKLYDRLEQLTEVIDYALRYHLHDNSDSHLRRLMELHKEEIVATLREASEPEVTDGIHVDYDKDANVFETVDDILDEMEDCVDSCRGPFEDDDAEIRSQEGLADYIEELVGRIKRARRRKSEKRK